MNRLDALDGWRGVAIVLVVINHATSYLQRPGYIHGVHVGNFPLSLGGFGVDIFFALSGFLITLLLLREREKTGQIRLGAFYQRRCFRILPPMLLYLGALLILSWFKLCLPVHLHDVLSSLFFIRNYQTWLGTSASIYTAHFWSLAVEEHFYLFWPFLVVFTNQKKLPLLALALAIACATWRLYDVSTGYSFHLSWVHPHGTTFPTRTDVRLDSLLIGSVAGILWYEGRVHTILKRLPRWCPSAAILLALTITRVDHLLPSFWSSVLVTYAITATITSETGGTLWRVLTQPWLRWLGLVSYDLYLWQQVFLLHPVQGAARLGLLTRTPLNLVACLIAASLSYYLIDKPFVRLGKRLAQIS